MKLIISENPEALKKRLRAMQKLKDTRVKVGLPKSAGGRLRFILAVQEHGSPLMRIPARPVIRPALAREETRQAMAESLRDAAQASWEGKDPREALEAAGQAGADGVFTGRGKGNAPREKGCGKRAAGGTDSFLSPNETKMWLTICFPGLVCYSMLKENQSGAA